MQQLCSTTTEEHENIVSCFRKHFPSKTHAYCYDDAHTAAFAVDFFDDIIYTSRITRQLLIRLMYEPRTNTYEWQAYMPLKHVNQNKCFRDRNNMIKELVVVLNGLGFLTPPRKMW